MASAPNSTSNTGSQSGLNTIASYFSLSMQLLQQDFSWTGPLHHSSLHQHSYYSRTSPGLGHCIILLFINATAIAGPLLDWAIASYFSLSIIIMSTSPSANINPHLS